MRPDWRTRGLGLYRKRRAGVDEVTKVLELFRTRYPDFTVKHFHEKLGPEHQVFRSYTWTKRVLQAGRLRCQGKSQGERTAASGRGGRWLG